MRIVLPYEDKAIGKIAILPQDIYISATEPPGPALNRYTGEVLEMVPLGPVAHVKVSVGEKELLAELPADTLAGMDLRVGQQVFVIVKLRRPRYFKAGSFL